MGEITVKTYGPDGKEILNDPKKENPESENLIQSKEEAEIKEKSEKAKIEPKLEPKPEYIDFQKVKKIHFNGDMDLENEVLLGIKKKIWNMNFMF